MVTQNMVFVMDRSPTSKQHSGGAGIWHVHLGPRDPEADPGLAVEIIYINCPGNILGSPPRGW